MADRAALMRSLIDDLGAAERTLADLERRAADLRVPSDERTDLRLARSLVASVRSWRQCVAGGDG